VINKKYPNNKKQLDSSKERLQTHTKYNILSQDEIKSLDELCLSQVDENGKFNYKDFLDLIILRS
jgi:hypothetical protein